MQFPSLSEQLTRISQCLLSLVSNIQVIQRRGDFGEPRENFVRGWDDYKLGFGNLNGEFWLGNEKIHQLTKCGDMRLRVQLETHFGGTAWAEYDTFRLMIYIYTYIYRDLLRPSNYITTVK